ncbi:hypothetical protein GTP46_08220 [Duganella sp. FT135W]|uniref:Transmembrane protein n=1 Tax=Duganella flavida TaxID=2692175 RepID=A0A6L8K557_9BURK|nr:hypothetical protein [Duganella flavida]MYM22629.1 hypothetical protein [Duganella flavida]
MKLAYATVARPAIAVCALTLAVGGARWLESSMLRHMLVQLPLLIIGGWTAGAAQPGHRLLVKADQYGVAGLTGLLFISAYWMIPRALELSLNSIWSEAGKFASLFLLGMVLPGSLGRCPWVVQLFFLGNFGAMMAIAGIQYQNMLQRLCNAYLLDDQNLTGMALTTAAILLSIAWCIRMAPALKLNQSNTETNELSRTKHHFDHQAGA